MTVRAHEHRWSVPHRGQRWCEGRCGAFQYRIGQDWHFRMTVSQFAEKWCPMVAGPDPETMMHIDVALAFEWNSYESWDTVIRVRFDFPNVAQRAGAGAGTRTDIMNGWRSSWHEDLCEVDAEAEAYYQARTQRPYDVGDNTYPEMRHLIQSATPAPAPPKLVKP